MFIFLQNQPPGIFNVMGNISFSHSRPIARHTHNNFFFLTITTPRILIALLMPALHTGCRASFILLGTSKFLLHRRIGEVGNKYLLRGAPRKPNLFGICAAVNGCRAAGDCRVACSAPRGSAGVPFQSYLNSTFLIAGQIPCRPTLVLHSAYRSLCPPLLSLSIPRRISSIIPLIPALVFFFCCFLSV